MKKFILLLLALSPIANSTQDVENPQQTVEYLRMFLSDPKVAKDVQRYAVNGCTWLSEIIWSGGGVQVEKEKWRYGGGFTINYASRSGRDMRLPFSYTLILGIGGTRTLEAIRGGIDDASKVDCS